MWYVMFTDRQGFDNVYYSCLTSEEKQRIMVSGERPSEAYNAFQAGDECAVNLPGVWENSLDEKKRTSDSLDDVFLTVLVRGLNHETLHYVIGLACDASESEEHKIIKEMNSQKYLYEH